MQLFLHFAALSVSFTVRLAILGSLVITSVSRAETAEFFCEVSASGVWDTGESFSGSVTDDGVVLLMDWRHSATDPFLVEFEAMDVSVSVCRRNGDVTADFEGIGNATFNGMSDHSYVIELIDNRGPPDSVVLTAALVRTPTQRSEGVATFTPARSVQIPAEIQVTAGASGLGWTRLYLDDVTCRYQGTGTTGAVYTFQRCTDPLESDFGPGMMIDVASARLRIQNADPNFELTVVQVDIGTGEPAPGDPDEYFIEVYDGVTGLPVYSFSRVVEAGDIAITELGPIP